MRKNKFRPGGPITSLDSLAGEIEDRRYVYYRHKPQHPKFIEQMTFKELARAAKNGWLRLTELAASVPTEMTSPHEQVPPREPVPPASFVEEEK